MIFTQAFQGQFNLFRLDEQKNFFDLQRFAEGDKTEQPTAELDSRAVRNSTRLLFCLQVF